MTRRQAWLWLAVAFGMAALAPVAPEPPCAPHIESADVHPRSQMAKANGRAWEPVVIRVHAACAAGFTVGAHMNGPEARLSARPATDRTERFVFTGLRPGDYAAEVFIEDGLHRGRATQSLGLVRVIGETW